MPSVAGAAITTWRAAPQTSPSAVGGQRAGGAGHVAPAAGDRDHLARRTARAARSARGRSRPRRRSPPSRPRARGPGGGRPPSTTVRGRTSAATCRRRASAPARARRPGGRRSRWRRSTRGRRATTPGAHPLLDAGRGQLHPAHGVGQLGQLRPGRPSSHDQPVGAPRAARRAPPPSRDRALEVGAVAGGDVDAGGSAMDAGATRLAALLAPPDAARAMASVPLHLRPRARRSPSAAAACSTGSTSSWPPARGSACSAPTAAASRRCCGSSPGWSTPTRARSSAAAGSCTRSCPRRWRATSAPRWPPCSPRGPRSPRSRPSCTPPSGGSPTRRSPPTWTRWRARSRTRSGCSPAGPSSAATASRARRACTCATSGLTPEALERPTRELSGGQRKLVALAACLARRPDVLLLDEPEAHLDMRRRDQLERLVAGFDGAVLMVSHDRHLLDECVSAIAELDRGRVRIWPGAYSAYTVARAARAGAPAAALRDPAEGDRAAGGGDPPLPPLGAHPRQRAHDHAGARQADADRQDGEGRAAGARAPQDGARAAQRRRAAASACSRSRASTSRSARTRCCSTSTSSSTRGERVGVVGPNGAGKTVLVRVLAGDLEPGAGRRWAGDGIEVGYLSQAAAGMDPSRDA